MLASPARLVSTLLVLLFGTSAGLAQQRPVCTSIALRDPPRTAYRCAGGLVIEAEAAAELQIQISGSGEVPTSAEVRAKAALIDLSTKRSFQIRTPQAIASVRGTVYAVDVTSRATAVFVVEGKVQVAQRPGEGMVTLDPGEGVDVIPGKALVVRRWPGPRVRSLLARFGR
jgi:hypothetical protein